jgi:hypothetical protein
MQHFFRTSRSRSTEEGKKEYAGADSPLYDHFANILMLCYVKICCFVLFNFKNKIMVGC